MEYYRKARVIVVVDSIILAFSMVVALVLFSAPKSLVNWFLDPNLNDFNRARSESYVETILTIIGAVLVIFLLFNVLMVIMLHFGTKQKSRTKLRTWYVTNCILTALTIFETIFVSGYWGLDNLFTTKVPNIIFIVYRVVTIHIIRRFIEEIKVGMEQNHVRTIRICTQETEVTKPSA